MGLFNKLMSKIFGGAPAATTPAPAGSSPASPAAGGQAATGTVSTSSSGTAPATSAVDVAAVLNSLAANNPEQLDWKRSIVDLMKLVGMDSSLAARKELATELGYTGDQSDSANMNIWLHKQVLKKLAENGGKVPQELLD